MPTSGMCSRGCPRTGPAGWENCYRIAGRLRALERYPGGRQRSIWDRRALTVIQTQRTVFTQGLQIHEARLVQVRGCVMQRSKQRACCLFCLNRQCSFHLTVTHSQGHCSLCWGAQFRKAADLHCPIWKPCDDFQLAPPSLAPCDLLSSICIVPTMLWNSLKYSG